jgi:PLP dependent protein
MSATDAAELQRIQAKVLALRAALPTHVVLVAVSKTKPAAYLRAAAAAGQRDFGENYVQEAQHKQRELSDLSLVWHFIGPLQSNKCKEVAQNFAWLHSLDREKLIAPLARFRGERSPLNVLLQVNIDDEASKSGAHPGQLSALAEAVSQHPQLKLRGLMAIPDPARDLAGRSASLRAVAELFAQLRERWDLDTLSLGMSADYHEAIAVGANMVRLGSTIFGARA